MAPRPSVTGRAVGGAENAGEPSRFALVESDGDTVVSCDGAYEGFAPRLDPERVAEE